MKKDNVYISICSRGANSNFFNLLRCIYKNSLNNEIKIKVIIIFNQSEIIKEFIKKKISKNLKNISHKIIYEKKIGISYVRNKSLSYLKYRDFDYCCFLDDDCKINNNFILNHLKFIKIIALLFQVHKFINQKKIYESFERNFHQGKKNFGHLQIMSYSKKILKNKINFSEKVSKYGYGEDQLFFSKMSKKGEVIKWNNNPVYEITNKNRENYRWFAMRNLIMV